MQVILGANTRHEASKTTHRHLKRAWVVARPLSNSCSSRIGSKCLHLLWDQMRIGLLKAACKRRRWRMRCGESNLSLGRQRRNGPCERDRRSVIGDHLVPLRIQCDLHSSMSADASYAVGMQHCPRCSSILQRFDLYLRLKRFGKPLE